MQAVDLTALLNSQGVSFVHGQYPIQNIAAQAPAPPKPKKKKGPTAEEKREKMMVDVLTNKDPFLLSYCKLLTQLDQPDLEKLAAYVKLKYGIP